MPSPLPCFSLDDVAFAATTSKLGMDLQDDKERYPTRHHNKKRDTACRLIVVRRKGNIGLQHRARKHNHRIHAVFLNRMVAW